MAPLITISAADVDAAGLLVERELPADWLSEALAEADATVELPGRVQVRLSRSGRADIVVRGKVEARFSVPCARTLEPAPIDVGAELSLLLQPEPSMRSQKGAPRVPSRRKGRARAADEADGGSSAGRGSSAGKGSRDKAAGARGPAGRGARAKTYDFSSEEAELDVYDGQEIHLDGFIREVLLLEIPIFPLSPEAESAIPPGPDDDRADPVRTTAASPVRLTFQMGQAGSDGSLDDVEAAPADSPKKRK